jgi:hypothetical protein
MSKVLILPRELDLAYLKSNTLRPENSGAINVKFLPLNDDIIF